MTNKTLGGGPVSSAIDLVRFGNGILNGSILTAAQRTTLWTPIGSYAYGWTMPARPTRAASASSASRAAARRQSYLRIYPDDGIVISVLANRWGGGHSASALSKRIGELMLAKPP